MPPVLACDSATSDMTDKSVSRAGAERVCDGGHVGGIGVLRLAHNQELLGLSSGEMPKK